MVLASWAYAGTTASTARPRTRRNADRDVLDGRQEGDGVENVMIMGEGGATLNADVSISVFDICPVHW